jgi:hypothetical protein
MPALEMNNGENNLIRAECYLIASPSDPTLCQNAGYTYMLKV